MSIEHAQHDKDGAMKVMTVASARGKYRRESRHELVYSIAVTDRISLTVHSKDSEKAAYTAYR